jgi:hypothetical protein
MSRVGKSCGDSALASGPISNDAMLRHACGYALANRDTRALQAYLGHRNFRHTVPYTELAPTRAVPWNFATRVDKKVCGESDEVAAAPPCVATAIARWRLRRKGISKQGGISHGRRSG